MLKNIFMLFISQGVNYLVPLILVPYLVRTLGAESYGEFNLALSIILYGCLFIDFGFNLYTTGEISKTENKEKIRHLYTVTIASKFLIFFPVALIIIFTVNNVSQFDNIKSVCYILIIQMLSSVISTVWLYQGLEKIRIYSLVNVVVKLLMLPMIFTLVRDINDINILATIQSVSFLLSALLLITIAKRYDIYLVKINFSDIRSILSSASHIFTGTISVSLYTMSTPIILGLVNTAFEVGQFSATDKIRGAFISIFLILSNVIYPRINKLKVDNEFLAFRFIKKITMIQFFLGLTFATAIYYSAPYIVINYLGSEFQESIDLLRLMSPMVILVPLSVILSNYVLLTWNYKKYYLCVPLITCIFHFSYIIPLSHYYGAIGSGIGILITEFISFSLLLIFSLKSGMLRKIYES
ncbi:MULTISPECIES: oligosaccharide flippase family protein [unclassified Vibrio]|uniref:oligosaccharide flippase family protein n=2 Tax=Vibrio TaxID=662 RepID=UPI00354E52F3